MDHLRSLIQKLLVHDAPCLCRHQSSTHCDSGAPAAGCRTRQAGATLAELVRPCVHHIGRHARSSPQRPPSFRRIIDRAGLRRIRIHDLRHTTATLLLAQGVSARVVMEILGHSQIRVTLNTYSHVASDLARAATVSIEEALWNNY